MQEHLFGEQVEENHGEDVPLFYAVEAAEFMDEWFSGSLLRADFPAGWRWTSDFPRMIVNQIV